MTRGVRRRVLICIVALVVASAAGAGAAPGPSEQRQAAVSAEVRDLREQVSEASAEEAELLDRLEQTQRRRRPLDAEVGALDRQVAALQSQVDAAEARLEEVQSEFVRAQTTLVLTSAELAGARKRLRDRAVAAYVNSGPATAAEMVLQAGSPHEVTATVSYLETLADRQREAVRRYSRLRDTARELKAPVESAKDEAKAQRDVVLARRAQLEASRERQQVLRQAVVSEQAEQERLIGEVRSRKADFEAQIAALRGESASLTTLLRGVHAGQAAVPAGRGVLTAPIPGAVITSGFGPRLHPIFGTLRMHDGLDYRATMGTPIRAAASGVVVSAGPRGGYGNATVIDHGGSLATLVAHQSAVDVAPGQHVTAGEVIGAVGSTGFSTGPHLHFEVRVNGTPVNPLLYL